MSVVKKGHAIKMHFMTYIFLPRNLFSYLKKMLNSFNFQTKEVDADPNPDPHACADKSNHSSTNSSNSHAKHVMYMYYITILT